MLNMCSNSRFLRPKDRAVVKGTPSNRLSRKAKLVELRARTDRDLVILMQRQLDRGLTLADVATAKGSPLYIQAGKAYETAKAIWHRISGLSQGDRLRIEFRLKELRSRLDQVPALAKVEPKESPLVSPEIVTAPVDGNSRGVIALATPRRY